MNGDHLRPVFSKRLDSASLLWALAAAFFLAGIVVPNGSYAASSLGPFSIPSNSMAPTIVVGDLVYTDPTFSREPFADYDQKSAKNYRPKRGDIVYFEPEGSDVGYLKRVVGMPGDKVEVREGRVFLDGAELQIEEKLGKEPDQLGEPVTRYFETLPNGVSYDIYNIRDDAPGDSFSATTVPDDSYFVLGDNRDNSMDSRFREIGFVPRKSIIGKIWKLN
ncbi:signal peptidase I [Fulvimarina sp. MAC8]|uniref:signal peptidase I n=1 Tax=Fulvimarina sp. MAC8 TaxID=3162874 RepID=UPI0032EDC786